MKGARIKREKNTVTAMISMYCRDKHSKDSGLCDSCAAVNNYAINRIDVCPFEDKPSCKKCTAHCYKPEMKDRIKEIMSYAGHRMIYKFPYMAIRHIMDGFRRVKSNER